MAKTKADPKRRPLSNKELKLVQGIAMGKTPRESALEAYNASTPESASVIASKTLTKVNVREALDEAFERHGISVHKAIKPIADGLEAERIQVIQNKVVKLPDHPTRINASWKALTLMGAVNQESNTNINFNFGTNNFHN